jgi:hypothetical protein
MLLQCEIDTVGVEIKNGAVEKIYMIDSAFHEAGLNYGDTVARIIKKLIRAVFIAKLVYPKISCDIVFVSPKCGYDLKDELYRCVKILNELIQQSSPEISTYILVNEDFAKNIYLPISQNINTISDDNDLFLRSIQLAEIAKGYAGEVSIKKPHTRRYSLDELTFIDDETPSVPPKSTSTSGIPVGYTYRNLDSVTPHTSYNSQRKTPRGGNQMIVFSILNSLIRNGKMTDLVLKNLTSLDYTKRTFNLSTFPVLLPQSEFKSSGFERNRFYGDLIEINGKDYLVCSQWIPERIKLLQYWFSTLGDKP